MVQAVLALILLDIKRTAPSIIAIRTYKPSFGLHVMVHARTLIVLVGENCCSIAYEGNPVSRTVLKLTWDNFDALMAGGDCGPNQPTSHRASSFPELASL